MPGNQPHAVLRFDAGINIGGGHAVRCLALADDLAHAGWRCSLAIGPETLAAVPGITRSDHAYIEVTPSSSWLDSAFSDPAPELIVVDHYGIGADEETDYGRHSRVAVFDDLANRPHNANILLDPTPGRTADDYKGLTPDHAVLCLGPSFAILRRQFRTQRTNALSRDTPPSAERILIAAGATDAGSVTALALAAGAQALPAAEIDVVLGALAPTRDDIQNMAQEIGPRVHVHIDVTDMATLMGKADFAIGAAGSSAFERCALGLPTIMIQTADNQQFIATALAQAGAARIVQLKQARDVDGFAETLRQFGHDHQTRHTMKHAASALCDGAGTIRFQLALLPDISSRNDSTIRLRLAEADDSDLLLSWQNVPETREFARNPTIPSAREHATWFEAKRNDPNCVLALVTEDGIAAGMLRLDPVHDDKNTNAFEVSILTSPTHKRRGIAAAALAYARNLVPGATLHAEVLADNAPSHGLFRAAGYERIAEGAYRNAPRETL